VPSLNRIPFALRFAFVLGATATGLATAQTSPAAASAFATVRGMAIDSIHGRPLIKAIVAVEGTTRVAISDAGGNFEIDSIPAGSYRLSLTHSLLDTLGLLVVTNPMVMRPGEFLAVDVATPSAARVVSMRCAPGLLERFGPAAVMGQVMDADSLKPAVGTKVQLVYEETVLGFKGKPIVRESTVDANGNYKICGVPTPITGKLQVFRNGVSSGQVDVGVADGIGLRSLSIAAPAAAAAPGDSTRGKAPAGTARLTGKVLTKAGRPVESARVSIEGSPSVALTNARGEFVLDSLPSGTQSVEVRKIGYASTDRPVELSSRIPASTEVVLDVAELAPMRIVAGAEKVLDDLGFNERKSRGIGHFIEGDQARGGIHFTDALRSVPNLRVTPAGNGRQVLQDARNPVSGCVNVFVDNVRWREFTPGDVDDFVNPTEVRAIETYSATNVPVQFQAPGVSSCATVVVWTNRYLNRRIKK
jgi:hypothetical protein